MPIEQRKIDEVSALGYKKEDGARLCELATNPLNWALREMRQLIDSGVPAHAVDQFGMQAIARASQAGNLEGVKLLMEHGARADEMSLRSGMACIHWAAEYGETEMIAHFLANGVDVNLNDGEGGPTPLHRACAMGHQKTVELLLEAGADVDIKNGFGVKPFDMDTDDARTLRQWYLAREAERSIRSSIVESSDSDAPSRRASKFSL